MIFMLSPYRLRHGPTKSGKNWIGIILPVNEWMTITLCEVSNIYYLCAFTFILFFVYAGYLNFFHLPNPTSAIKSKVLLYLKGLKITIMSFPQYIGQQKQLMWQACWCPIKSQHINIYMLGYRQRFRSNQVGLEFSIQQNKATVMSQLWSKVKNNQQQAAWRAV